MVAQRLGHAYGWCRHRARGKEWQWLHPWLDDDRLPCLVHLDEARLIVAARGVYLRSISQPFCAVAVDFSLR